jgi:parallel beta-helix repeat protein
MLALVSSLVLIPMAGRAQVPRTISYQGSLSDSAGNPVNAALEMMFSLYDSPTAAVPLWREPVDVTVQNGTFSVVLGTIVPLDAALFEIPLYLGILVDADAEMTPRQALTAVGYAFRAKTVESDTLSALGCAPGQIASWNGSAWACAADNTGGVASDLVCATCVSTGELAFDTATQPELDGHGATAGAHHSRYTNAEAVAAAGPHVSSVDGLSGGGIGGSVAVHGGLLVAGQLTSTLATGAPLSVASSDLVTNLNADRLDSLQASEIVAAAQDEVRTPISALPFTISVPGSYYLTGDLAVPDKLVNGITVNADHVTIDLMGFSLIGPGGGSGNGIYMNGRSNVEIRNGTVRGFGNIGIWEESFANVKQHRIINVRLHANISHGLRLRGFGHIIKDCTAGGNGGTGMTIDFAATVTGNTAYNNGIGGILVGPDAVVTHNTARDNATFGISSSVGAIMMNNVARGNGDFGIGGGSFSNVTGNVASVNAGNGIWVGAGATVTGNTARLNNQSNLSDQGGLRVESDSLVKGNTLNGNLQNNIFVFGEDNAIEENLVTDSTKGISFWTTSGNFFANNRAAGNTTSYSNSAFQTNGGGNVSY